MTLSIIIVSYNVKYFLEQCLCSVKAAAQNIDAEIIVIDNCSSDNSIDYLQPHFPWVKFIKNSANSGFAKANNKALEKASGKYILFLNPDTLLAEDTLEQCLFFYENHPDAGAIGVRMIDGSGRFLPESKRSFPSPGVSFYKLTGLSSLFPSSKHFGKYALGYLPEQEVSAIDVVAGACMMISKKILLETGGFDERFFMYAEDIDLSYRIQKRGYQNYYLGNISVIHFKGESTKKGSLNYVKSFYKAMNLFVKKYYRGTGSWLLQRALQTGIYLRGFVSLLTLPFQRKRTNEPHSFQHILLLGAEADMQAAKRMIEKTDFKKTIDINHHLSETASFNNKIVVFCTGDLSYKKSFELLQKQTALSYKWFGENSNSIVGSDDKNKSGEAFTVN